MKILNRIISMFDISNIKFKKKEKSKSIIKDVVRDPDAYKLEAYVENGEVVVKIKKKELEISL